MVNLNSGKHTHLTDEQRQEIQDCLKHGMSFKGIGKRVGKDQTTISKELSNKKSMVNLGKEEAGKKRRRGCGFAGARGTGFRSAEREYTL
jgi:IS30 family transposase